MPNEVDQNLEDLYELVLEHCNLEPVKDLLRTYKRDESLPPALLEGIRVSGEDARAIVGNLEDAVNAGAIPVEKVYALLREAEENGNQHIFFFRAKTPEAAALLNDRIRISKNLLGEDWEKSGRYPGLRLKPLGYCWSDFRFISGTGWVAKLYGHDTAEIEDDHEEGEPGERARWVKYVTKDIRVVCLARWSSEVKLLELRVPSKRSKQLLHDLKGELQVAVNIDQICEPWELSSVRKVLFKEARANSKLYECGNWQVVDSESYAISGQPLTQAPDEAVNAVDSTRQLISALANSDEHDKRKLVVHWKPSDSNGNKKNLRTILGTNDNTHELIVAAQASSKAIDDVVNQLLQFEE